MNGDMDSEALAYPEEHIDGAASGLQSCVEFRYFDEGKEVARLTLVPIDTSSLAAPEDTHQAVQQLHETYRYA